MQWGITYTKLTAGIYCIFLNKNRMKNVICLLITISRCYWVNLGLASGMFQVMISIIWWHALYVSAIMTGNNSPWITILLNAVHPEHNLQNYQTNMEFNMHFLWNFDHHGNKMCNCGVILKKRMCCDVQSYVVMKGSIVLKGFQLMILSIFLFFSDE